MVTNSLLSFLSMNLKEPTKGAHGGHDEYACTVVQSSNYFFYANSNLDCLSSDENQKHRISIGNTLLQAKTMVSKNISSGRGC